MTIAAKRGCRKTVALIEQAPSTLDLHARREDKKSSPKAAFSYCRMPLPAQN
jgi:hypothetical protein